MLILSIILGVYTGILLSAFNARPLWNTSILGPLFLVSGFSTGLAAIMWLSKNKKERKVLARLDLIFIAVELFLIIHLFMGFMAGTAVSTEAASLFLGGPFTVSFWVFVVVLGLIFPAVLESLELWGFHIPRWLPPVLILFGGLMFRFVMVEAGQITRFLY
jgi:formate-dependent nitrite reductase membrane component NrfD